jgi:alkylated DNA repair dioxygenase AlkB
MNHGNFVWHALDDTHGIWVGKVPADIALSSSEFDECWALHPAEFLLIKIQGRLVRTPRWQQAFGRDYAFSGQVTKALTAPPLLGRFIEWGRRAVDGRLNGILVNWYDGEQGHYIGRHRDSTKNLIKGAPIVTISSGESRLCRFRPWRGKGRKDFEVVDGTVIAVPYTTNLAWTHEVPAAAAQTGRRISITLRAFDDQTIT